MISSIPWPFVNFLVMACGAVIFLMRLNDSIRQAREDRKAFIEELKDVHARYQTVELRLVSIESICSERHGPLPQVRES